MDTSSKMTSTSIPSIPLEDILVDVAHSLVQAQQALDSASLASEIRIRETGLSKLGLAAHWYAIPELNFDLRLAFEIGDHGELQTQMANAEYQSKYGFNLQASSLLHTRIAAVPSTEARELSLRDQRFVLQRVGQLKTVLQAYDRCNAPHFVIRFRPYAQQGYTGGVWHVLLLDVPPSGPTILRALASVDDSSGNLLRVWTDRELEPTTVEDVTFTPEQVENALYLVNTADATTLDLAVALGAAAVKSILNSRPVRSLPSLSKLSQVGPASLKKIRDFVPITVEGVSFTGPQVIAMLEFVNQAARETLLALGLRAEAVDSLLAARPFNSLADISPVSNVGPASLKILLAHVSQAKSGS